MTKATTQNDQFAATLGRMEGDMRTTKSELCKLGVLFEDMDYRLQTIGEAT